MLNGASLGRAAIEARQRFVAQYSHVDPSDLKTAIQFNLLGDLSVHPVRHAAHAFSRVKTVVSARASGLLGDGARAFRRERINRTGHNLAQTVGAAVAARIAAPPAVKSLLESAAAETGMVHTTWRAYRVGFPVGAGMPGAPEIARSRRGRTVHVVQGPVGDGEALRRGRVAAIIATLEHGRIVHLRRVHSR